MRVVFVHGAFVRDGAWWWGPTASELESRTGVGSVAVELPSVGEGAHPLGSASGLAADAAALRAVLDEVGDAVVVAHSYGGTVVAEAGAHPAVRHLVLISSYLPSVGTSQAETMSREPTPVAVEDAGHDRLRLSGYGADAFGARFLQDVPRSLWGDAWARVVPQAASALATPTTAGWRGVESTYLVCLDDRSTTVDLQREHAARATRRVELPLGHHPFLADPGRVAGLLAPLVTPVG